MLLDEILTSSSRELALKKKQRPLKELQRLAAGQPPPLDFAAALRGERLRLIAEFKRASPSKGAIRAGASPEEVIPIYASSGAAAISVLTETGYFRGSPGDLLAARQALRGKRLPLLRKDFIFDPYQVYESRAYGADALLLIVAVLDGEKLEALLKLAHQLGMACLVETHHQSEVATALANGAKIIGINNRDLGTFKVNLATTARLKPLIPPDRITVAESGLKERRDIEKMRELGVDAVLIGEALMTAPDIAARIRELGF
ncbi:MAG: indole-3-glycerol phosphate synthase TrpC [Chloroflexota bacterium]